MHFAELSAHRELLVLCAELLSLRAPAGGRGGLR